MAPERLNLSIRYWSRVLCSDSFKVVVRREVSLIMRQWAGARNKSAMTITHLLASRLQYEPVAVAKRRRIYSIESGGGSLENKVR